MPLRTPLRILVLAALPAFPAFSQAFAPKPAEVPAATKDPEYVTTREFTSKLFVLKHQSAGVLYGALRPLLSGFKGSQMIPVDRDGMKLLTVRDFPENIAAVEAALARLDVPPQSRKDVDITIQVLFASRQELPGPGVPNELKDVVAALRSTLNFRSFTSAASFQQRTLDGASNLYGGGQTPLPALDGKGEFTTLEFKWQVGSVRLAEASGAPPTLTLQGFNLRGIDFITGSILASMSTDLTLKAGERVVVGTSLLKGRGLVVILTARQVD